MFATDPSNKHQHQAGSSDEQGSRKIRWCDQHADHCHWKDHWQKTLFKIFYLVLLSAEQPADIHDQSKFGQVRCLKSHIYDRKSDPTASFIQFNTKKQCVE